MYLPSERGSEPVGTTSTSTVVPIRSLTRSFRISAAAVDTTGFTPGNGWGLGSEAVACHEQEQSALVTLPPLATIWLVPET